MQPVSSMATTPRSAATKIGHHELGKLLLGRSEGMLVVHRCLILIIVEFHLEHRLELFQVLGRVAHEDAVARAQDGYRESRERQAFAALDAGDFHLAVGFLQHFGKRLAIGETAFGDVHHRAEDARLGVLEVGASVRQEPWCDKPQIQDTDGRDNRARRKKIEHMKARHAETGRR